MLNSAMKTVDEGDRFVGETFAWTEQDCSAIGLDRRLAMVAWNILNGLSEQEAMYRAGYHAQTPFELIASSPHYIHAMRVMVAQFTNGVVVPEVIVMLRGVAMNEAIEPQHRVKAGSKLHEIAGESLQRFKDEYSKQADELNPDQLQRIIKQLEANRSSIDLDAVDEALLDGMESVQIDGLTPVDADYLSDLL